MSLSSDQQTNDVSEIGVSRRGLLRVVSVISVGVALAGGPVTAALGAAKSTKRATKKTKRAAATNAGAATSPNTAAAKATSTTSATPGGAGVGGASGNVVVAFTYAPSGGGRVHNPYVAVWVETPDGAPVRTLTLQYQPGKGRRWLADLKRWYEADQRRLGGLFGGVDISEERSSPTKLPGTQKLLWDGNDDSGTAVAPGAYVLFVEAAREKGPYQLVREEISTAKPFSKHPADNGELQALSVVLRD